MATLLLVAAVSSCGGSAGRRGAAGCPRWFAGRGRPAGPGRPSRPAVADVFRRYYQALLARDFGTACELNAAETRAAMLDNLEKQGGITAASCEEGFQKIYAVPGAAAAADRIATTARVGEVTVTGDQAAIRLDRRGPGQVADGDQPDAPGRRRMAAARHRQLSAGRRHRVGRAPVRCRR